MRTFRPLREQEERALQEIDQATDPMREELQRMIYELENSRVPIYRLALERIFLRQLVKACRDQSYRPRAVARVLERIPHASSSQEWAKLAPEERHDRMLEALPGEIPPTT